MTTLQISVPDDIGRKVNELAQQTHVSLQDLLVMALMEKLSTIPDPDLEKRAARGKREDFDAWLASVPAVPPETYDKLAKSRN